MSRLLAVLMMTAAPALAEVPRVVTDIAPIGSIVAHVMQGVGEPNVLIPNGASPHDYALRPSEARNLAQADMVVWVGPSLTRFLEKPIAALAGDVTHVTLMDGPFALRPFRDSDAHEDHNDHDAHDDHDEDAQDDHSEEAHHDHGDIDPHLWLDPANAVVIAGLVADALANKDPQNATTYRQNFDDFQADMELLIADLTTQLAPFEQTRFLVLHDAFQYFEARFHIHSSAAVMTTDADAPGPARIAGLRDKMSDAPVVCAFAEPQMNAALIDTVLEGQNVRLATLNPMGDASLPVADQYAAMLRTMAQSMAECLGQK